MRHGNNSLKLNYKHILDIENKKNIFKKKCTIMSRKTLVWFICDIKQVFLIHSVYYERSKNATYISFTKICFSLPWKTFFQVVPFTSYSTYLRRTLKDANFRSGDILRKKSFWSLNSFKSKNTKINYETAMAVLFLLIFRLHLGHDQWKEKLDLH